MVKEGRTVMLAVDHGYFQGPTTGLENPRKTITPLLPYVDSLMLTRGVLRTSVDPESTVPIVLRVSGGTSVLKELSDEVVTTSIEEALRLNASAVAVSIFVGAPNEKQTLANLAGLVSEGERYGMPVLAVTAVGREMVRDARYLGLACRIAAELGASVVPVIAAHANLPPARVGARLDDAQGGLLAGGAGSRLVLGPGAQFGATGRAVLAGQHMQPGIVLVSDQDLRDVALHVVAQGDLSVGERFCELRKRAHVGC